MAKQRRKRRATAPYVNSGPQHGQAASQTLVSLKLMVASSVYGFESEISQICSVLSGYGYEVLNSHIGTIPVHPGRSNLENCLAAVDCCNAFFGIIRPFYGSGLIGARSITHEEMLRAVTLNKPRWFVVHGHVTFARQLLRQYRFDSSNRRNRAFVFKKTPVMDDARVLDLYDDVIRSDLPAEERTGNWAQEFHALPDILAFLQANFGSVEGIRMICSEMAAGKGRPSSCRRGKLRR